MSTKEIKFVEYPIGAKFDEPLPDGFYAQITYSDHPVGMFKMTNPFPWTITAFQFKDGEAIEMGGGSDPAAVVFGFSVEKVFLVGVPAGKRADLEAKLEKKGYTLVPA